MDSIPPQRFAMLSDYLDHGGQLILLTMPLKEISRQRRVIRPIRILPHVLQTRIQVEPAFAVDANCGTVTVQLKTRVSWSSILRWNSLSALIQSFNGNQITEGLEQVMLRLPVQSGLLWIAQISLHPSWRPRSVRYRTYTGLFRR